MVQLDPKLLADGYTVEDYNRAKLGLNGLDPKKMVVIQPSFFDNVLSGLFGGVISAEDTLSSHLTDLAKNTTRNATNIAGGAASGVTSGLWDNPSLLIGVVGSGIILAGVAYYASTKVKFSVGG